MRIAFLAISTGLFLTVGGIWLISAASRSQNTETAPSAINTPAAGNALAIPTLSAPSVNPSTILINTPTMLTVTVAISPTPISNSVNLIRLGAKGTQPIIMGVMHDDGSKGDAVQGDGTYTIEISLNEPNAGQLQLEVSAAFRGSPRRIVSSPINISVWQTFSDSTAGLTLSYPADFSLARDVQAGVYDITALSLPTVPILILTFSQQTPVNPDTWFGTEVDQDGSLMASGSVQRLALSGGSIEYLFLSDPGPDYVDAHGPLPYAIILSANGSKVVNIIGSSEGDALNIMGYTQGQADSLRSSIINTISVH